MAAKTLADLKPGDEVLWVGHHILHSINKPYTPKHPRRVKSITKKYITLTSGVKYSVDDGEEYGKHPTGKLVCFSEQGLRELEAQRKKRADEQRQRDEHNAREDVQAANFLMGLSEEEWLKLEELGVVNLSMLHGAAHLMRMDNKQ